MNAGSVVINSTVLTPAQIAEFERTYAVRPQPGSYWYDSRSGLYGLVGQPTFGSLRPGHHFGGLARDASNGNTRVLINGRELPQTEWMLLSRLLGVPVQQGMYWLDDHGNAGVEGNPLPLVNLHLAARPADSTNGGDNFWSSSYSAGNHDSSSGAGYVSVPGYGPVGYGF